MWACPESAYASRVGCYVTSPLPNRLRLSGCGLATSPPHADCAAYAALITKSMLEKDSSEIKLKGYDPMPFNIQSAYLQYKQYILRCISIYLKTSA